MLLTDAAFALLVANSACNPMGLPEKALKAIAMTESGLNTEAVHRNTNGTADYGLFQINEANLPRLGLTPQTALDPCKSMSAGESVLLSRYNTGNPMSGIANGYAKAVLAQLKAVKEANPPPPRITLTDQVNTSRTRLREVVYHVE